MESGKVSSGLGRGLAGILGDSSEVPAAPGYASLVGGNQTRQAPEVRQLVNDLAVRFIADMCNSNGVLIARRNSAAERPSVTAQLPDDWQGIDSFGFELVGELYQNLASGGAGTTQIEVEGRWVLVIKQTDGQGATTAASVVRSSRFSDYEILNIARMIKSVSLSTSGDDDELRLDDVLGVEVEKRLNRFRVGIVTPVKGTDGFLSGDGSTEAEAAAIAACQLCPALFDVRFAGDTLVNGSLISLVVIRQDHGDGLSAPVFGLAVGASSPALGAIEAVIRASRALGIDPLKSLIST